METRQTELVRYDFTDQERLELSEQLAQVCKDIKRAERDKAATVAACNSQLKELEAERDKLAELLDARYEMREVECFVDYNKPVAGKKLIVILATGETLREERMSGFERAENPIDLFTEPEEPAQ